MDETLDSASLMHDKETAIFGVLPNDDSSSIEDSLSIDDDSVMQMEQNCTKEDELNGRKNDIETIEQNYTYAVCNELGNKIISFPELKNWVEMNFVCKKCIFHIRQSAISMSTLFIQQQTYGIATVVKITCGHSVEIISE